LVFWGSANLLVPNEESQQIGPSFRKSLFTPRQMGCEQVAGPREGVEEEASQGTRHSTPSHWKGSG